MTTRVLLCLALLTLATPASADTYIEAAVMEMDTQTWTSGLKSRTEAAVLVLGGRLITITRVDQGVQWTLDAEHQVYQEHSVALPYPIQPAPGAAASNHSPATPPWFSREPGQSCTGAVTQLPTPRRIAGYDATGYKITCAERPTEGLMVWLAPVHGLLAQVQQEAQVYAEAYEAARYASFPAEERPTAPVVGMGAMSDLLRSVLASIFQGDQQPPSGFPLAVEGLGPAEPSGTGGEPPVIFEVRKITTDPIDPALFNVPREYQKVADLSEVRMRGMLEEMKSQGVPEDVQRLLEHRMGEEGGQQP